MSRLTRKQALAAIYGAGTEDNQAALVRLYVENRIGYGVALAEFRRGQRFARHIAARDAVEVQP